MLVESCVPILVLPSNLLDDIRHVSCYLRASVCPWVKWQQPSISLRWLWAGLECHMRGLDRAEHLRGPTSMVGPPLLDVLFSQNQSIPCLVPPHAGEKGTNFLILWPDPGQPRRGVWWSVTKRNRNTERKLLQRVNYPKVSPRAPKPGEGCMPLSRV